jgi:hypothetical protein
MELFESPDLSPLEFCLQGWMNTEICVLVYPNLDTRDECVNRIMDDTARIKNHEEGFRRKTRDLRTRVAKIIEVDGRISNIYYEL